MGFIVWDCGECHIFKTAKEAWDYINPIRKENPILKFQVFRDTATNINNHVLVLRDFDTVKPWENAPPYLRPKKLREPMEEKRAK